MSARGRHYEFAERGWEAYCVSAGRTHRSAPTAGGKNGWKVPDAFCPLSAKNWVKRCILWQRRSTCSRTVLVSLRRGGPMCPPVVGIANSPKMGENRTTSLLGGHAGPPLRSNTNVVRKQVLLYRHWVCRFAEQLNDITCRVFSEQLPLSP